MSKPVLPTVSQDIAAISRISAIPSILKVVSELTGMRATMVARVTEDDWTACAVYDVMKFGLSVGGQLEVTTTLCKEVHDSRKAIVIQCATKDPVYATHKTPKLYNIESYIAIPILRPNGQVFGTLCAIDSEPAQLDAKVINSLTLFTELISRQLRDEEEMKDIEQSLWDERKVSQLREQFIAVLGHDLRTPLAAVVNSAEALLDDAPKPGDQLLLQGIKDSSHQMERLISDVLDFARGRLGSGLYIARAPVADLSGLIERVTTELARVHRDRSVRLISNPISVSIDEVRFQQMLTNLIGNALQHSPAQEEVVVEAGVMRDCLRITVTNGGPAIPPEVSANLFAPFVRAPGSEGRSGGLGLGLYIASQIARAHGGSLQVDSIPGRTVFTFIMPLA